MGEELDWCGSDIYWRHVPPPKPPTHEGPPTRRHGCLVAPAITCQHLAGRLPGAFAKNTQPATSNLGTPQSMHEQSEVRKDELA